MDWDSHIVNIFHIIIFQLYRMYNKMCNPFQKQILILDHSRKLLFSLRQEKRIPPLDIRKRIQWLQIESSLNLFITNIPIFSNFHLLLSIINNLHLFLSFMLLLHLIYIELLSQNLPPLCKSAFFNKVKGTDFLFVSFVVLALLQGGVEKSLLLHE